MLDIIIQTFCNGSFDIATQKCFAIEQKVFTVRMVRIGNIYQKAASVYFIAVVVPGVFANEIFTATIEVSFGY